MTVYCCYGRIASKCRSDWISFPIRQSGQSQTIEGETVRNSWEQETVRNSWEQRVVKNWDEGTWIYERFLFTWVWIYVFWLVTLPSLPSGHFWGIQKISFIPLFLINSLKFYLCGGNTYHGGNHWLPDAGDIHRHQGTSCKVIKECAAPTIRITMENTFNNRSWEPSSIVWGFL